MTLLPGNGSDPDTFGESAVWVMDSLEVATGQGHMRRRGHTYPVFYQAELCMQFRNNQTGHYPAEYHALKEAMVADGRLHPTPCPQPFACPSS